jgi:hypothetical protein
MTDMSISKDLARTVLAQLRQAGCCALGYEGGQWLVTYAGATRPCATLVEVLAELQAHHSTCVQAAPARADIQVHPG